MADAKSIIIQGRTFTAKQPYDEGHVLTAAEARALNQVRLENLRNNFANVVKAVNENKEGNIGEHGLLAAFEKYDAEYSFAMPGQGGGVRRLDPIEREARKLAREILASMYAKEGRKITDVPAGRTKEEHAELVEANIDKIAANEKVLAKAKRNVQERAKSLEALAADFNLDGTQEAA